MLRLRCTTYHYPAARGPALHDLELAVPHGAVVGLVGPNEAGKSTLCLVAAGLAPSVTGGALDGLLEIDGEAMTGRPPFEVAQRVGLGLADPQGQLSGITGTVFEEIGLGPMNLGLPADETVRRVEAAAAAVGIERLLLRSPTGLSGGETQLVAISSLLAMEPRHLILDEPTSQLDPLGARLVAEALHRLAHSGMALLIAEHRTDLLDGLCDRVAVIEAGTIIAEGPADETLSDPRLAGLGVAPPSRYRLARACARAGLAVDPADLGQALGGWPHR
ncbi:MAG: ABC transporter ATP-binding protein [Chloroflexota bacterium]|nr:MAG: ABC transporter ATP-binding protein [Chloroflexota bacterium]